MTLLNKYIPDYTEKIENNDISFFVKGHVYLDDHFVHIEKFKKDLIESFYSGNKHNYLNQLNGFYFWVYKKGDVLLAGVDHVRSIPLFYGKNKGIFYISNDAEWVRQQVDDEEMEPIAREEFLLAGHVTGSETLYPNVKQLQAGEWLEASERDGDVQVKTGRYYHFWHSEPFEYKEMELYERFCSVTRNAIRHLTTFANGRQLVIPLSGGYDSRLIVTMLRSLDYENVLCFAYGVPGNRDVEFSRKIAAVLGFKWAFIEYSTDLWRTLWQSDEAEFYRQRSANHTSLPFVQDWPAIKKLLEKKLISQDAIIVPGHSGDFISGRYIPDFVFKKNLHSELDLLRAIEQKYLSNASKSSMSLSDQNILFNRIRDRLDHGFDGSAVEFANLFELWEWQERQSKYIVNAVRVYDHFCLQWWLPLWDKDFVCFWQDVPLFLRKKQRWYKKSVNKLFEDQSEKTGNAMKLNNANDRSFLLGKFIEILKSTPDPIRQRLKRVWSFRKNSNHSLAFEGLVPFGDLKLYIERGFNIIGIFSDLFINKRWDKSN